MTLFFVGFFIFAAICFVVSILACFILLKLKKRKASYTLLIISGVCAVLVFVSLIASLIASVHEPSPLPEPKITTEEQEFFYISKIESEYIDFIVFYPSESNELICERINFENLKFIIVENTEDEKIVKETHTYYEQLNYYTPPKIEEDYVEAHYKLYVTEKTFKEIFE